MIYGSTRHGWVHGISRAESGDRVLPSDGSTLSRAVRPMLAGEDGRFINQASYSHLAVTCP